jgi:uncharacterized protein YfaS (alpha-2-macroglobulin family)
MKGSYFRKRVWGILGSLATVLVLLSLACSLPFSAGPTPAPSQALTSAETPGQPAATNQPVSTIPPPELIESQPPPGTEISLQEPITLYFNQAMQRASVEGAISTQPQVTTKMSWQDDRTLTLTPQQPLAPDSSLTLQIAASARSSQDLQLVQPISLTYRTSGRLKLAHALPDPGSQAVDPGAAILAAFDQPVVAADAETKSTPAAFQLDPGAQGRGEWLNSSTYAFYPNLPLQGGITYTVQLDPNLHSAGGGPFQGESQWAFHTAAPRLVSMQPAAEEGPIRLDTTLVLTFNQPMDQQSVEASFSLTGPTGPVPGISSWNTQGTKYTFRPGYMLARNAQYRVHLSESARGMGNTPIEAAFSSMLHSVPNLAVTGSQPTPGGVIEPSQGVILHFSTPLQTQDFLKQISLAPSVPNLRASWNEAERSLNLTGNFTPATQYKLSISSNLTDVWGGRLGHPFSMSFHSASLPPSLRVTNGADVLFVTPLSPQIPAQATNLTKLALQSGSVPLQDFFQLMGADGPNLRQSYRSADVNSWVMPVDSLPNQRQPVQIPLAPPQSRTLRPGLYFLRVNAPASESFLVVLSRTHLTFKLSPSDAFVWAVDLQNQKPVANAPVAIYAQDGSQLASGQTGSDGVFQAHIDRSAAPFQSYFAVMGQPGEGQFGLAANDWNKGVGRSNFGILSDDRPPHLKVYLYSDRPIYRPGQVVYFDAIARQTYNGRYRLPEMGSLSLGLYGPDGDELDSLDVSLSALGSGYGQFSLPEHLAPGTYSLRSLDAQGAYLPIQVADYHKPELDLRVTIPARPVRVGEPLAAQVTARYYSEAPAGDLRVHWALYASPDPFQLPSYQVGPLNLTQLTTGSLPGSVSADSGLANAMPAPGKLVSEGDTRSEADGSLSLNLSTQADSENPGMRQRYTLVVSAVDASGLPVSARASARVDPTGDAIGIHSDSQLVPAGEQAGFDIQVIDWRGNPAGGRTLRAEFQKVGWVSQSAPGGSGNQEDINQPNYTPVASTDFKTNAAGQARIAFDPPGPGTYLIKVVGRDSGSDFLLWVSGAGQASWPDLLNQRLRLIADRERYSPGDTAQIFIPNPWKGQALALISVERGTLLRHQVLSIQGNGRELKIPLSAEDAPNVYISVTLIGHDPANQPDFRQGMLSLAVMPEAETLHLSLNGLPKHAAPGDALNFELTASDDQGNPVQGEFSLAVVDKNAFSLAKPNTQPMQSANILEAFYGQQPLGVRTGLDLAATAQRQVVVSLSPGGGGEFTVPQVVGQNFPDTAYWETGITTGPDGKAQLSVPLPDSPGTWLVQVRGLTEDTRVGQAEMQVVTSSELSVQPIAPHFLVVGDHLRLEAILQNNTDQDLRAQASLEATGFDLDDPTQASQPVSVPARGKTRVEWWGSVQDVKAVDLTFRAQAGDLQDTAQPPGGSLPVLRYPLHQAFQAAGSLEGDSEQSKLVSLPLGKPLNSGGQLRLELAPSLAAAMIDGLQALDSQTSSSAEADLWRFLPDLETYRVLQQYGLQTPALQARLDDALKNSLQDLLAQQNEDGGWPWWPGGKSNVETSAYVVFGLGRARQAGVSVETQLLQHASDYLRTALSVPTPAPTSTLSSEQLDTAVLIQLALQAAGQPGDPATLQALYRLRSDLDPGAQALLALALGNSDTNSPQARDLISGLETAAIQAEGGAYWEPIKPREPQSRFSVLANSALVTYALAQRAPGSPLLGEAVRYLMAQRQANGGWDSTFDSAWSLMALAEVQRGTGELGGDFTFSAALNGTPLASGQAGGPDQLTPVTAVIPASLLRPTEPNTLRIQRQEGTGRLYYLAALDVSRPVDAIPPLRQGLSVERIIQAADMDCAQQACPALKKAQVGQKVRVRLALTLAQEAYSLRLEDALPAGARILSAQLQAGQTGSGGGQFDPRRPYENGWGGWLFHPAQVFDDHISWAADHLPAGSYELVYTLVLLQPGDFQWLPARAWLTYFPEVQGSSAGSTFTILP